MENFKILGIFLNPYILLPAIILGIVTFIICVYVDNGNKE